MNELRHHDTSDLNASEYHFSKKDVRHSVEYTDALAGLQQQFLQFVNSCDEGLANLGLFITPQERRRELFLYEVYYLHH
mgnify:CR=1 FL=1